MRPIPRTSTVLPALQIIGGFFILFMVLQRFRAARSNGGNPKTPVRKATFWAGFFACVSNSKAIVFFVALFPAFISPDHNIIVQSISYGAIFVTLDAAFIIGYALLALHTLTRTAACFVNVDVLSGIGLLGVGTAMIFKGYKAMPSN